MARLTTLGRPTTAVLDVATPFDLESLLEFLGHRTLPGVEAITANRYSRTLRLPHGPASLRLDLEPGRVHAHFWLSDPGDLPAGIERSRWLLDLDADPATIDGHLHRDPHLAASVEAYPGLRVPGHVDGFEMALRAVVGQQISVAGARTIVARLVGELGETFDGADGLTHLFPTPEALAATDPERLPMPRSRGRALVAIAEAVSTGDVRLDRTAEPAEVRRALLALPGIGPWTADYIALRALGDPDIFLAGDLGVRQGLARMGLDGAGPEVIRAWAPWRSYALMHVWKQLGKEPA
jgi:AraC family transcriptional regulator of adaptative response / DNA-3-methyladenine glycosylase II